MSIIWDEKSSAQGKRQTRVSGCEAQASEGKLDSSSIVDEEAALEGNLLDTKGISDRQWTIFQRQSGQEAHRASLRTHRRSFP